MFSFIHFENKRVYRRGNKFEMRVTLDFGFASAFNQKYKLLEIILFIWRVSFYGKHKVTSFRMLMTKRVSIG